MAVLRNFAAPPQGADSAHDLRFRDLLPAGAWALLPQAVRNRFGKPVAGLTAVTYAGRIIQARRNRWGKLLARLGTLIGAPLPLEDAVGVPAVVTVTEDGATGGQFWTRMYGRTSGFPQVIHSSKRFAGPTGLEEYLGCGFGIALTLRADSQALHFHSDHYFFRLGTLRLKLPRWLSPGELTISHMDFGGDWFAFILVLWHPVLGELMSQTGMFRERATPHQGGIP